MIIIKQLDLNLGVSMPYNVITYEWVNVVKLIKLLIST